LRFDEQRCVGARAEGFAASEIQRLFWHSKEIFLLLRLRTEPGVLRGRVIGPDGMPRRGARVFAGAPGFEAGASFGDGSPKPPTFRASTDADGAFTLPGIFPGPLTFLVREPDCAPGRGVVTIHEGADASVVVALERGATIVGDVVDADGAPVPDGVVTTLPRGWLAASTRTDSCGRFRLQGLDAGTFEIVASGSDALGEVKATVHVPAGGEATAHLRFTREKEIAGRVVDEAGSPIAGCRVTLDGATDVEGDWRHLDTPADGSFAFSKCLDADYTVRVFDGGAGSPSLEVEKIRPGSPPLELRVRERERARSFVKGRLLDADGAPLEDASISFHRPPQGGAVASHRPDGSFQAGPLPAGTCRMHVVLPGMRHSVYEGAGIELDFDSTRDLGEIRILNRLVLRVTRDDGAPAAALVRLWARSGGSLNLQVVDGVAKSGPLPPGEYDLSVFGSDTMVARFVLEIRANEETKLDVTLRSGVLQELEFVDEEGASRSEEVHVFVKESDGTVAGEARLRRSENGPLRWPLVLAKGTYRVEARSDTDRTVEATLTVPNPADPIPFTLR
jgi:hypothetical protein